MPLICRMAHSGDIPQISTPPPAEIEPAITTIEIDPRSVAPVSEHRRARPDEAGSSRSPMFSTLRYFCDETREYQIYHGRECRCGAARSFPDTLVHDVEQERDYLIGERYRLADLRDFYLAESERFQRIAARARDRVEALETRDRDQDAEMVGHLITIDTLRDELELEREQHIEALEENAELRSLVRRQGEEIERLRQLIPDVDERLAEDESEEPEMWQDELGADDDMVQDEIAAARAEIEIEPVEQETDDAMDLSEQGSEDVEESSEPDDDDDEDYHADDGRADSSDGSDDDSGDDMVPEAGWVVE